MFRWDSADGSQTLYYVLEGMGCCFCPMGSALYAWHSKSPFGPFTRGVQLNPPRAVPPTPLLPNPTLVVGPVVANGMCLAANSTPGCVPSGKDLPPSNVAPCAPHVVACVAGAAEQQWRMTGNGKRLSLSHFTQQCNTIVLPRRARDKHRKR